MVSRSLVLGYHGCDLSVARKVAVGDDQLLPSRNAYDWLGGGLYFWEDSPARALRWARDEAGRNSGKVQTPAVLGTIIDLGNCLNLIEGVPKVFTTCSSDGGYADFSGGVKAGSLR